MVPGSGLQRHAKNTFNISNDFAEGVMYYIEGASCEAGIFYRWTRAQAHVAAMEDNEELSC